MLVAEVRRGEALQGQVRNLVIHYRELLHRRTGLVRAEVHLCLDPLGTLTGDGTLGQLVAQPDLELGAVERGLSLGLRDEELATLLAELVGRLSRHEGRRREDELEGLNVP